MSGEQDLAAFEGETLGTARRPCRHPDAPPRNVRRISRSICRVSPAPAAVSKELKVSCRVATSVYENGVRSHAISTTVALPQAYVDTPVHKLFEAGSLRVGRCIADLKWLREQLRIEYAPPHRCNVDSACTNEVAPHRMIDACMAQVPVGGGAQVCSE